MGVWLSCLPGEQRAVVPDERLPGQLQQHQGGAEPAGLRALLPAVSRGPLRRPRRPSRVRPPVLHGRGSGFWAGSQRPREWTGARPLRPRPAGRRVEAGAGRAGPSSSLRPTSRWPHARGKVTRYFVVSKRTCGKAAHPVLGRAVAEGTERARGRRPRRRLRRTPSPGPGCR